MKRFVGSMIFALCAIASLVSAQSATIDGVPVALTPAGEAYELRIHNGALPDNWGQAWKPGNPILFDRIDASVPGHTMLLAGPQGVIQSGDRFELARPGQYVYVAKRNGVPLWNIPAGKQAIYPGDTFYARFAPADDPWELRYLAKITPEARAKALQVLGFDEARIARWPFLQKVLGWYRYDAHSDVNTPVGQRNMGFLLNPWGFQKRWGVPIEPLVHWYGIGTRQAGVSLTNEHYGSDGDWFGQGLRMNDPAAVTIGLYLLRLKGAYGLVDCDAACPHKGKWRTESGEVRGTSGMVPSWAKEYDQGAAAAYVAVGGFDDFICHIGGVRMTYLLGCGHEWQGAGGARNEGHYLENLHLWYTATGNPALKAKAEQEISFAMTKVGSLDFFPENPGSLSASTGEGILALAMTRRWVFEEGLLPALKPKLDAMLDWYVAHGVAANGRCGYFYDGTTLGMSGYFQGLCWLSMEANAPQHAATFQKIEQFMFTVYANTPNMGPDYGGEGPGWEKWVPWIGMYGATR